MYKKYLLSILLGLTSLSHADQVPPLVEVKAGYFFFSDSCMRNVYRDGGFEIQASGSYPLWCWLSIYGSIGYLKVHGKSLHGCECTSLWQVPFDIGLKPIFALGDHVQYYFSFGPRYFHLHQHNNSTFVNKNKERGGLGFFVNTGFNFIPCEHFFIGLFGEYAYEKKSFCSSMPNVFGRKHVQVGGFTFGASLGYAF